MRLTFKTEKGFKTHRRKKAVVERLGIYETIVENTIKKQCDHCGGRENESWCEDCAVYPLRVWIEEEEK